ncbi:MAG: hypothetical protein M3P06_20095 [Acidobacteriota bacterium]|nr:hypothetical protein [Acidobacteriota bacterium]
MPAAGPARTSVGQHQAKGYDREEPLRFTGHERDFDNTTPNDSSSYIDYMHARYYARPITVGGTRIVDGHHRYVAGRIVGREPPIAPGTASRSARVYKWVKDVYKDLTDWGNN